MSDAVETAPSSRYRYFQEDRPCRDIDGEVKRINFQIGVNPDPNCITMTANNVSVDLFSQQPNNFDRSPYWLIYITQWNNFAAYGDQNNSNQAYELAVYANAGVCRTEGERDRIALILNDMVSALLEHKGGRYGDYRVSHVIFRQSGGNAFYERCFQKALKTHKRRVWEFF